MEGSELVSYMSFGQGSQPDSPPTSSDGLLKFCVESSLVFSI